MQNNSTVANRRQLGRRAPIWVDFAPERPSNLMAIGRGNNARKGAAHSFIHVSHVCRVRVELQGARGQ